MRNGRLEILALSITWQARRRKQAPRLAPFAKPYRLHLGPGPNWHKPDDHWINVDIDPRLADLVLNFQQFESFPLPTGSVECIYASHVFEHMSVWVTDRVFTECLRVLQPAGVLRMVLPDVEKSIQEYVAHNAEFPLFRRRRERAERDYGLTYTLFDCLREDFISRSGQMDLLGEKALAHQNAWDFESLRTALLHAGFERVEQSALGKSRCGPFAFEGSYECEALEEYRSLYVEAVKGGGTDQKEGPSGVPSLRSPYPKGSRS